MNLAGILWTFQFLWTIPNIVFSLSAPSSNVSQFQVHSLPGSPALPPSWAGRLPVPDRKGNEIFFWLFDAENPSYDDNLISKHTPCHICKKRKRKQQATYQERPS